MPALEPVVRWLLTYLLHSSLLLGAAALVCALLRERRLAIQEAVLRAALVGGLVTATLQVTLDLRPLGGAIPVPSIHADAFPLPGEPCEPVPSTPRQPALSTALPPDLAAPLVRPPSAAAGRSIPEAPPANPARSSSWAWSAPLLRHWRPLLLGLWTSLALAALIRLAVAAFRLRLLLGDRRPLVDLTLLPRATHLAQTLGLRGIVRLSTTPRLTVPLATGVLRPEVCLPTRVLSDLAPDEQLALCAHEMAHVARRDPVWLLVTRLVEALLPVQPLNLWARRRLQDVAECLSDDLAVAASDRRLGLARSLVDVACWKSAEPSLVPLTASGAFGARSRLALRVERLMDPLHRLERPRRLLLPVAAAAVLTTALITPVVSGQGAPAATRPHLALQSEPIVTPDPPAPPVEPPDAPPAPPVRPAPAPVAVPHTTHSPTAPHPEHAPLVPHAAHPPAPAAEELTLERAELEKRLEELTQRIEERVHLHQSERAALEAEIATLAENLAPNEKEIERLRVEIEKAAEALVAEHRTRAHHNEKEATSEARRQTRHLTKEHARRLADLERELHQAVGQVRLPDEKVRALGEKARALAAQSRPTDAELDELRQLTRELTRHAVHEAGPGAREAARLAREAALQAREVLRQTREELRRVREDLRRAQEQARHDAAEAARATQP